MNDARFTAQALYRSAPARALKQLVRAPLARGQDWLDRRFDAAHGLETCQQVGLERLAGPGFPGRGHAHRYEASPILVFNSAMRALPGDPADYGFIDFGSGKGRTLILAARQGFRELLGVEFSAELNAVAERNLARYRAHTGQPLPARLWTGDAREFAIPDGDWVFFFYNPFPGSVLEPVIENIRRYHRRCAGRFFVVYLNPRFAALFDGFELVRPLARRRFALERGAIYQSRPSG